MSVYCSTSRSLHISPFPLFSFIILIPHPPRSITLALRVFFRSALLPSSKVKSGTFWVVKNICFARGKNGLLMRVNSGSVPMDEDKMVVARKAVEKAGIRLAEGAKEEASGWDGGVIWLVPTDQPIAEWKPIATREL